MINDDFDLMKKTAQGDLKAFEIIVERYHKIVLNIIYKHIGNQTEAEDLSQEVFLRVFKSAKTYKPEAKFTTWLYRITANLCFNFYKKNKQKLNFISLNEHILQNEDKISRGIHSDKDNSPESIIQKDEKFKIVKAAIDSLPEKQKMAVILQRYEGLSYKEISVIMNCSVSSIESLIFRAKQTLKKLLEKKII